MNIFFLHENPDLAARYHCDKHVCKMIVESCQLLNNQLNDFHLHYKKTHQNHPCSLWLKLDIRNFNWLLKLTNALLTEYAVRYSKMPHQHACYPIFNDIRNKFLACINNERFLLDYFDHSCHDNWLQYYGLFINNRGTVIDSQPQAFTWAIKPEQFRPEKDYWFLNPLNINLGNKKAIVQCYRAYYIAEKSKFAKYSKGREAAPDWLAPFLDAEDYTGIIKE